MHSKDINFHQSRPLNLLMLEGKFQLIYKQTDNCAGFGKEALEFDREFRQKVEKQ